MWSLSIPLDFSVTYFLFSLILTLVAPKLINILDPYLIFTNIYTPNFEKDEGVILLSSYQFCLWAIIKDDAWIT